MIVPGNQNKQTGLIELGTSGGNGKDSISNATNHTITCCGGTLGSLVTRGGIQYILSNNHVLAESDAATIGDPIVQPGLIDAQCDTTQATTVATLSQFVNLESEDKTPSSGNIDAAIAQVVSGQVDPTGNILYLGPTADSNGVPVPGAPNAGTGIVASLAMGVAKSGRTTGLTCSTVLAVNTNTSVEYNKSCDGTGASFTVDYNNQVDVAGGGFGAEGDSGSLIVSQDTADPVALLYGGSDTDTVANPVTPILNFFASGGNAVTFVGGSAHQVVGCMLPTAPQSASKTVRPAALANEVLQKAVAARDAQAPALLAHPEVQAVGVGASLDNPAEPAIVFFVTKGQTHTDIPGTGKRHSYADRGRRFVRAPGSNFRGGYRHQRTSGSSAAVGVCAFRRRNAACQRGSRRTRKGPDAATGCAGCGDYVECGFAGRSGADDLRDSRRATSRDSGGHRWIADAGA